MRRRSEIRNDLPTRLVDHEGRVAEDFLHVQQARVKGQRIAGERSCPARDSYARNEILANVAEDRVGAGSNGDVIVADGNDIGRGCALRHIKSVLRG